MALVEVFETTLKEVVNGKRLSASKMSKLTDTALKCMENDTQLVSILYRTHKSLPATSKVSSLYAFDALCRAARHQATKQGLTGDIHAEKGNSASFLLKMEGVLDGLIHDMVTSGKPDSKEKTKKILDIWAKSNTFPTTVLTRLTEVAAKADKETNKASTTTSDPRTQVTPPTTTPPATTPTVESAQAALLALLSSAAAVTNTANGQTSANTGIPATPVVSQPQLDPLQLALLQQLANKANIANVAPVQPITLPTSLVPQLTTPSAGVQGFPSAGPSQSPPHSRDPHPDSDRRHPKFSRYDDADGRGRGRGDYYEGRRDYRGSPRGGFRGRERDDFRGRPNDRDRFRDRGDDWGPPPRRRHTRSRSPPRSRFAGRKDIKPYSPPRRPSLPVPADRDQEQGEPSRPKPPGASEMGKDEFGRDIRPPSPGADVLPASAEASDVNTIPVPAAEVASPPSAPIAAQQESSAAIKSPVHERDTSASDPVPSAAGLDKFDLSTFDPTNPASWKALGDAFQVTNKYVPSQEELMQLVASSMAAAAGGNQAGMSNQTSQWADQSWSSGVHTDARGGSAHRGGRGRGWHSRGSRGSHGFGNSRSGPGEWGYSGNTYGQDSDAIVLGGNEAPGEEDVNMYGEAYNGGVNGGADVAHSVVTDSPQKPSGGAGGQMKKVGDKWVFVREGAVA